MTKTIRYQDRVAVITGAGSGLGRSHALAFARRGAKVVVNDLGSSLSGEGQTQSAADRVVNDILSAGGEAVANYDSVERGESIIETAMQSFGRVDIVINNAGILRDRSFTNMTDNDWDLVYRVHMLGAYKVSHAAWPIMRSQSYGRIINTSSAAGLYGAFGQANYATAKLGLYGLTQTLAVEGKKYNIQANAIAPIAASRMTETVSDADLLKGLKPGLVTPLVLRLCAEHNQNSGDIFEVGGGWMAKLRWQRNTGIAFNPHHELTPEQIDTQWAQLNSYQSVEYPGTYADAAAAVQPVFNNLGIKP